MTEATRRAIEESIRRMRQTVLRMHEEIEASMPPANDSIAGPASTDGSAASRHEHG